MFDEMKFNLVYVLREGQSKGLPVLFCSDSYYYGIVIILIQNQIRFVFMSMHNLYQQEILDHYQNPRNFGLPAAFDFISPQYNPSCGDSVTICGSVQGQIVSSVSFEGKGCVLSLAMASLLTQFAQGKTIDELLVCNEDLVGQLLKTQLGIKRMQCGMLPLQALQKGLRLYREKI